MNVFKKPLLGFFFLNGHTYFVGMRGIYTGMRMECKESIFQNRAGWRLDLTTWLSHEFKSRANWVASLDFCPVVLQLAWLFNCPAYSARVQLLAACKPRASREIKPRDFASLYSLEHFFTLSHVLPLHDSHLNTGFLSAVLQANLSRNKANTWLIKFNLTQWLGKVLKKPRSYACSFQQMFLLKLSTNVSCCYHF